MRNRFILVISVLFLLPGLEACKPTPDPVIIKFNEVDKSLGSTTKTISQSLDGLYEKIKNRDKAPGSVLLQADTIFNDNRAVQRYIDSLQSLLLSKDPNGESFEAATELFITSRSGDRLYQMLGDLHRKASLVIGTEVTLGSTGSLLGELDRFDSEEWAKTYFFHVPTVAAVTILSKFKSDCTITAFNALNVLNERLNEGS